MDSLEWVKKNRKYLKLSVLAKEIGTDAATMTRIVEGKPDSAGYAVKLPEKCKPVLDEIVKKMKSAKNTL